MSDVVGTPHMNTLCHVHIDVKSTYLYLLLPFTIHWEKILFALSIKGVYARHVGAFPIYG